MEKKATSGPMNELVKRLTSFSAAGISEFRVVIFEQSVIDNQPIEEWPLCEALIAFYSDGFPLHKAQQYAQLRRPFVFNDMMMQEVLFDRRLVYRTLEQINVPVPVYTVIDPSREGNVIDEQAQPYPNPDPQPKLIYALNQTYPFPCACIAR